MLISDPASLCGVAYQDMISSGQTLGAVQRNCAVGYYSFGHEMGHSYGATHNREVSNNPTYPTAYGYLMRPPTKSGYRTNMA
jgi:hypothetical protein